MSNTSRASCLSNDAGRAASFAALPVLMMLSFILSAGCTVGPDYKAPESRAPDAWHERATQGLAEGQANLQTWWEVFGDAQLTSLIDRTEAGNWQLKEALYRVQESRALRNIAVGEWFPTLDGSSRYQRSQASENAPPGPMKRPTRAQQFGYSAAQGFAGQAIAANTSVPGPLASAGLGLIPPPRQTVGMPVNGLLAVGFDSSWEIDVFGGIRRNVESAEAGLQASQEQYRDLLVSLLAEVALNYTEARTLQARLAYARANVDRQRQTLTLVQSRFNNGLAPQLDVAQAESNLANSESTIPTLEAGLVQTVNRLGVLAGQQPATLHEELATAGGIPIPPGEVTVGLPVDLLRQRPDVRAAERLLAAQTAQIGVATADLLPRFSLSGTFALEGNRVEHLGNIHSLAWSFGPAVRWNLFDGLRNWYRVSAAEAVTEQARARYEQTVLNALQDVENAMVAYKQEQVRREALDRAAKASAQAVDLVKNLYENGLTDFQNVLDTERSLFQQQDQLAVSVGQVTKNLIALYKALGGGWRPDVPATQPVGASAAQTTASSTSQPAKG